MLTCIFHYINSDKRAYSSLANMSNHNIVINVLCTFVNCENDKIQIGNLINSFDAI